METLWATIYAIGPLAIAPERLPARRCSENGNACIFWRKSWGKGV